MLCRLGQKPKAQEFGKIILLSYQVLKNITKVNL